MSGGGWEAGEAQCGSGELDGGGPNSDMDSLRSVHAIGWSPSVMSEIGRRRG
jgi:hypothetical protein